MHRKNHPSLPRPLQPLSGLMPRKLQYPAIRRALNTLFREPMAEGELAFLEGKTINVVIEDSRLEFSVSMRQERLFIDHPHPRADLVISGKLYTFLTLATRREDADTLFFHRQLKSEGDTELGLYVKNFLDGLDPQSLPAHHLLDRLMQGALGAADQLPEVTSRLPGPLRGLFAERMPH